MHSTPPYGIANLLVGGLLVGVALELACRVFLHNFTQHFTNFVWFTDDATAVDDHGLLGHLINLNHPGKQNMG